jgi:hypothetical protein
VRSTHYTKSDKRKVPRSIMRPQRCFSRCDPSLTNTAAIGALEAIVALAEQNPVQFRSEQRTE